MQIKTDTIIRTICLALALINQILVASGHAILPIADEQIELLVSTIVTIIFAIWGWWKNNSFTRNAIIADEVLTKLKNEEYEITEEKGEE